MSTPFRISTILIDALYFSDLNAVALALFEIDANFLFWGLDENIELALPWIYFSPPLSRKLHMHRH